MSGEFVNGIVIVIFILLGLFVLHLLTRRDSSINEKKDIKKPDLKSLSDDIKLSFDEILNKNIYQLNLNKTETEKREAIKIQTRKKLRACSDGDLSAKIFVIDSYKELLEKKMGINEDSINDLIHFETEQLTIQDKFEILLYHYKSIYSYDGLRVLIKKYGLDKTRWDGISNSYVVEAQDIEEAYNAEKIKLTYLDKLAILAQRLYQGRYGFGIVDEIFFMKIDGVSGGLAGIPFDLYDYDTAWLNGEIYPSIAFDSVFIFFEGKTIKLSFLGFESQNELVRVCKNIHRFGNPGQLSASRGYITNDTKNGSRVTVLRPPFADRWAFLVRKHDGIVDTDLGKLFTEEGSTKLISILKYLVKGCMKIVITGEMGSGKTTLLKLLIQFLSKTENIRVHEQIFELNLSRLYKDRNILALRETDSISGQEGLEVMRKLEASVIILGEIATQDAASYFVEVSQISKMTMCTHHGQTTPDLIDNLSIAQLKKGGFGIEYLAERQVVKAINIDIHMENKNGHRYISRITEIIPKSKTEMQNTADTYETKDILVYKNGSYVLENKLSSRAKEKIQRNLEGYELEEFNSLNNSFGVAL